MGRRDNGSTAIEPGEHIANVTCPCCGNHLRVEHGQFYDKVWKVLRDVNDSRYSMSGREAEWTRHLLAKITQEIKRP